MEKANAQDIETKTEKDRIEKEKEEQVVRSKGQYMLIVRDSRNNLTQSEAYADQI